MPDMSGYKPFGVAGIESGHPGTISVFGHISGSTGDLWIITENSSSSTTETLKASIIYAIAE